jgi:hypothetical protein
VRPATLLLVLAAAGIAAGVVSAAEPSFRKADAKRALEIGLRLTDVGKGWSEGGSKPSPYTIDTGSTLASVASSQCIGPPSVAKTEADMLVTGSSISMFSKLPESVASIVLLFRNGGYADQQIDFPPSELRTCIASELKQAGAGPGLKVLSVRRYPLATGSPLSTAFRITVRFGPGERVYFDLVAQVGGRGLVETAYVAPVSPPSEGLELRLAHISASRLARYAT